MEKVLTTAVIDAATDSNYHPATSGLANHYIHLATSHHTRKAYRADIRHYESFGGKLPATPEMIAHYLEAYAATLNPRTLARRLIAIRHWHTYQAFPDPTNHPAIQKTMAGITRTHGRPKDKARAISPDELTQIHDYLVQENSLAAIRDDALFQVGFFAALRRSELAGLCHEHLTFDQAGIEILLPSSKTDQTHEGQYSVIPNGNDRLCPVKALNDWLERSRITSGPIFRRITQHDHLGDHALAPLSINRLLKNRAQLAGIENTATLSSHSLRRGLATSAARASVPLQAIMRAGRWKQTNTVMEYIEASDRFMNNAANMILNPPKK